ncbi:MAG: hypothetical protein EXS01_05095 [Phycisphaerales bacterium]|nr:hypothetical protein [Phycisphaerales bacterium]
MKPFNIATPLTLALSTLAFGQAGAEGEYDLLVSTKSPAASLAAAPVPISPQPLEFVPVSAPATQPRATLALATSTSQTHRGQIGDYDFGEVVQTLRNSVQPLAGELDSEFPRFIGQIDDAIILMEAGRNQEAVALSAQALDGVLAARDRVVNPLWEAQFYMTEQIALVRSRLAASLSTNDPTTAAGKATAQSNNMLDQVALRISQATDPARKKRLVSHYNTLRTLSKVRARTLSMTPDQRKLWFGVLKVLEQASVAHQQVLTGSEALFAQLDGTSSQLRDYLGLMQTVEGVDQLLGSVDGGGMEGFVDGMRTLQTQMESFSTAMEGALEASMIDLESRVDSMQAPDTTGNGFVTPTAIDEELQSRIERMAPSSAGKD